MGFFDSFLGKKPSNPPRRAAVASSTEPPTEAEPARTAGDAFMGQGEVHVQHGPQQTFDLAEALAEARDHLDRKDLPSALQIYEQIIQSGIDLAEPLTTLSGDLGATGHIEAMVELIAPLYDPARHGAAPGLNLLQAYLHLHNDVAAQQVIDALDTLTEPHLRDRLDGFRTALADLRSGHGAEAAPAPSAAGAEVSLVTVSKPIWTYGLEQGDNALPTKHGRERRIAFLAFALVGEGVEEGKPAPADHPLAPTVRGLPLALAEYCWFSPDYRPVAVVGVDPHQQIFLPPRPFTGEQARQLFGGGADAMSHAVTGAVRAGAGGIVAAAEITLWDVRKARLVTTLRATGPDAVGSVWIQLLTPVKHGPAPIDYAPPADPVAHAIALDHALHFFLAEKKVRPLEKLAPHEAHLAALADYAQSEGRVVSRLVFLGALRQCTSLGLEIPPEAAAVAERLTSA